MITVVRIFFVVIFIHSWCEFLSWTSVFCLSLVVIEKGVMGCLLDVLQRL